jgi:multidrug efflux pump subunit AcrA (membrane-fusion protein)
MATFRKICLGLAVSLMFFLAACSQAGGARQTPTPLPPLVSYEKTLYPVESGPIAEEYTIEGVVTPYLQEALFFRTSGFISRVPFKGGDTVKQGDIIAELQIDDLLIQLQQAEIDLAVAQASLDERQKAREFAIARAEHSLKMAEINLEQVRSSGGNKYQVAMAEESVALAKLAYQEASEQTTNFDEQSVKRTQLVVERLKSQIAERQIIAPFDGVLFQHNLQPGDNVEAFKPVITIGDPTELVIRTNRESDLANKLNEKTEAYLRLTTDKEKLYPLKFLPNFVPFSNEEDTGDNPQQGGYFYFTMLQPPERALIPVGKPVEVQVVTGRKEDTLLLPPAVIREFGGLHFVILKEGDKQRRVEIQIGLETIDWVEVIGDLKAGDMVVGP